MKNEPKTKHQKPFQFSKTIKDTQKLAKANQNQTPKTIPNLQKHKKTAKKKNVYLQTRTKNQKPNTQNHSKPSKTSKNLQKVCKSEPNTKHREPLQTVKNDPKNKHQKPF